MPSPREILMKKKHATKQAKAAPAKRAGAGGETSDAGGERGTGLGNDQERIALTLTHIPDRDQEFRIDPASVHGERWVGGADEDKMVGAQDADEGESSVVSDPAFEREGASRVLRVSDGDRSVEEHMTPAAIAGSTPDDERGIVHMSRDELERRAEALGIPGRAKMTKSQLSAALHGAASS
jgi:hypothetical protein